MSDIKYFAEMPTPPDPEEIAKLREFLKKSGIPEDIKEKRILQKKIQEYVKTASADDYKNLLSRLNFNFQKKMFNFDQVLDDIDEQIKKQTEYTNALKKGKNLYFISRAKAFLNKIFPDDKYALKVPKMTSEEMADMKNEIISVIDTNAEAQEHIAFENIKEKNDKFEVSADTLRKMSVKGVEIKGAVDNQVQGERVLTQSFIQKDEHLIKNLNDELDISEKNNVKNEINDDISFQNNPAEKMNENKSNLRKISSNSDKSIKKELKDEQKEAYYKSRHEKVQEYIRKDQKKGISDIEL